MTEPIVLSAKRATFLRTTKKMNALWYANLEIELDEYIKEESYLEFGDELWIAKVINEQQNHGFLTLKIEADHCMSELNDYTVAPFDTTGTAGSLLTTLLNGTGWQVGTVNVTGNKQVVSDKRITVLAALWLMTEKWTGEFDFRLEKKQDGTFLRYVDFKTQIGSTSKKQPIRYDKNSDYISREKDTTHLITRLYPYGKDDLTCESVNPTGKIYLDSANIGNYKTRKEYALYTNIDNATDLYNYAVSYLALYDTPVYRYTANIADMTVFRIWDDEGVSLGDTARVYNKDLNINVDCRIKKIVKDYADPNYFEIEFDNVTESLAVSLKKLYDVINRLTPYENDSRTFELRDVTVSNAKDGGAGLPVVWLIYVGGILQEGYYQGPVVHVDRACHAYELWAYCAWKPTAGNVTIRVNRNGVSIGEVTIPQGAYVAPGEGEVGAGATTAIDVNLSYGDYLNIDILAADGVAQRVSVEVRCN